VPAVHTRADRVQGPEARYIRRFGIRSYVGVLLGTPARPLGMLFVNFSRSVHRFTPPELAFVETLTTYLSVAVERRRLVEGLREAVVSLQTALLPASFPEAPELAVAAEYRSASEVAQVGGDFYDVVRLSDGRVAAFVGDVCGKGVAAARHTARLRFELRAVLEEERGAGAALTSFNGRVSDEFAPDEYVTMNLVVLDPRDGTVEWASAGHPPPLIAAPDPELPETPGDLPVGMFPSAAYRTGRLRMPPGATLVLYTDGVIESRRPGGAEFGFEGLLAATADAADSSAEEVAGHLLERVTAHAGGSLTDDAAVLVLRRLPIA
jgi:serine phosphatase RsbU (regulator of sigma subunit)